MATPAPQQLKTAITNLKRMQAMSDRAYPQNLGRISDAFDLLTEPESNSNPGLTIVLNLVEGAFWAIGASVPKAYTAVGNFAASFLSGMVVEHRQPAAGLEWPVCQPPGLLHGRLQCPG
jgi:hypothetical protein